MKENKITLSENSDRSGVVLTKSTKGYDCRIQFNDTADEDMEADKEGEEEEEVEEDAAAEEKESEEEKEDEGDKPEKHTFSVDLKPANKDGPAMRLYCIASKDEKLYFEGLSFAKTWENFDIADKSDVTASVSPSPDIDHVEFEYLNEETQDKIADFMDLLKIDDELARFVQATAIESQRKKHVSALQKLESFMKA